MGGWKQLLHGLHCYGGSQHASGGGLGMGKEETKLKSGFFSYQHIKEQAAPLCCPLLVTYVRERCIPTLSTPGLSYTQGRGAKGSRQVKL